MKNEFFWYKITLTSWTRDSICIGNDETQMIDREIAPLQAFLVIWSFAPVTIERNNQIGSTSDGCESSATVTKNRIDDFIIEYLDEMWEEKLFSSDWI